MRYSLVESVTAHPRLAQEMFDEYVSMSSSQSQNWDGSEDSSNDGKGSSVETTDHFFKNNQDGTFYVQSNPRG
jgi:hypothetical protein